MENKLNIRKSVLQCRKAITSQTYKKLSDKIQHLFLTSDLYRQSDSIMLYIPINNEPDTDRIISTAMKDGKVVLLPGIIDDEVYPVVYKKGMPLKHGKYNVKEPAQKEVFPVENIDTVIVPGVAFDRYGNRLGYGKAYYDRFLSKLDKHTIKVGLSFTICIVENLPVDPWDISLDVIITEIGFQTKEQGI
ncbi:MAG: 5-formyltetrahydrofolate cyclo-ligase [bacterium]